MGHSGTNKAVLKCISLPTAGDYCCSFGHFLSLTISKTRNENEMLKIGMASSSSSMNEMIKGRECKGIGCWRARKLKTSFTPKWNEWPMRMMSSKWRRFGTKLSLMRRKRWCWGWWGCGIVSCRDTILFWNGSFHVFCILMQMNHNNNHSEWKWES